MNLRPARKIRIDQWSKRKRTKQLLNKLMWVDDDERKRKYKKKPQKLSMDIWQKKWNRSHIIFAVWLMLFKLTLSHSQIIILLLNLSRSFKNKELIAWTENLANVLYYFSALVEYGPSLLELFKIRITCFLLYLSINTVVHAYKLCMLKRRSFYETK